MKTVRGIVILPIPIQLTDAPASYSLRARILGELCGSCDLGLHEFGCMCPPSMPAWWGPR